MTESPHAEIEPFVPDEVIAKPRLLQRLEAEAAAMDTAFKIAKGLSQTEMVPDHFQARVKGDAATFNLAAAILYGAELGLSAPAAAQNVFIIKGKPAVYARTMAGQVRRAGYQIQEVEASDQKVVWRAERDGHWAFSEWTMERADQAGYTSNPKYKSNPMEMLRAKCIAEVCRIQYQDVLLGMAHSVEELQLDNVTVQRVVKHESSGAARLRELAAAASDVAAEVSDEQVGTPGPVVEDVMMASNEQQDQIRKLYKARGVTGQTVLGEISLFLQLEEKVTSLHSLTHDDAEAVLADLQKEPA